MKTSFITLIVLIATVHVVSAIGAWERAPTVPQGSVLTSVTVVAPNVAVAVGWDGRIVMTTDGGMTWVDGMSGLPDTATSDLWSVSFSSPNIGTAVGTGNIIRTINGGLTWTQQTNGVPENGDFLSVVFTDDNNGLVIGSPMLRTSDGGTTWQVIPSSTEGVIVGAWMFDPTNGLAIATSVDMESGRVLHTSNGGDTWRVVPGSDMATTPTSIVFADPLNGWITGGDGLIMHTTDGGLTWQTQLSTVTSWLSSIAFADALNGYAVGINGVILHTTDGGQNWLWEPSGTTETLWGVAFRNGTIIAVGGGGITGLILWYNPTTSVQTPTDIAATGGALVGITPNPASMETSIAISTSQRGQLRLTVVDELGREVAMLRNGVVEAGASTIRFNASNLAIGAYFVRCERDGRVESRALRVVR